MQWTIQTMNAEIISVGTELLLGEITNTDASYIASQLPALGIELYHVSTVGDNRLRITQNLAQAFKRAAIIILTGGLGPTQDDITREAVADFLKETISIDAEYLDSLKAFFKKRNIAWSPTNEKQAGIIPSAEFIPNHRGTAPGWWIQKKKKIIITLPGPTGELREIWLNYVSPRLKQLKTGSIIISKTLKTFGLPESRVDELVGHILSSSNPTVGIYAKTDGIHLRIAAKASTEVEANILIGKIEGEIRLILDDYIWGTDAETVQDVVAGLLVEKGLTIATAESQTGGLLSSSISNSLPDSNLYKGGFVVPHAKSKILLQIGENIQGQYGKITPEINAAMASGVRELTGSDIGLAVTLELQGDKAGNHIGGTVFICVDNKGEIFRYAQDYPGLPFQIRQRAVTAALFELKRIINGGGKDASYH